MADLQTKEGIERLRVDEGDWRPNPRYICRECGAEAHFHPETNWIWGCKECGFTTYSVFVFFREA